MQYHLSRLTNLNWKLVNVRPEPQLKKKKEKTGYKMQLYIYIYFFLSYMTAKGIKVSFLCLAQGV